MNLYWPVSKIINFRMIDEFSSSWPPALKLPLTPKPLESLLREHRDVLPAILRHVSQPTVRGRYLHWDQLRRLDPPPGLDHEQWWLGVKLSRSSRYRSLPMRDSSGRPFVYLLPDRVLEALHHIDSRASGRIGVPEQVTNPDTRDRFIVSSLIEEAITSSQLEGAATTRAVAAEMIRAGRRPRDRSERMILNNYRAMHATRSIAHLPLTPRGVLDLQATLTSDTLDDPRDVGRMQHPDDERVRIWDNRDQRVAYVPPPAAELPRRLDDMVRFANHGMEDGSFLHPVIHAIALHFWLAYDHPFADGNGRTARALFYWSMVRHGYWLFEFISISRLLKKAPGRYARSFLHAETDGNDLTYFIVQQIDVITRAIGDLDEYIGAKVAQVKHVEALLRRASGLNHRQLALLGHAIRHPHAHYTTRSHMTSHGIAYATARADLFKLSDLGLLQRRRIGKKTNRFVVPLDLERRIRAMTGSEAT